MYEFPFGAGQQLNLNWIINEIITLHKQLDPDYELPNFDTTFPYMNLNTLNLDWILRELKAIKDLAPTEDATLLKMVANALIAETYDTTTQYNVDDIVYRDNEKRLFKCVTATPAGGEPFDSNKWFEVDVGEVLTDLLVNGGTANAVTNVRYNDHKIQQEINGTYSDVIVIEDTPTDVSDRLPSSKAVYNLNGAITNATNYKTGDSIPIAGMYASISNSAGTTISCSIRANKIIPSGRTYTLSRLPDWIRGNQLASISHFTFTLHAITRLDDYTFILDFDITPLSGVTIPSVDNFITYFSAGTIYIS